MDYKAVMKQFFPEEAKTVIRLENDLELTLQILHFLFWQFSADKASPLVSGDYNWISHQLEQVQSAHPDQLQKILQLVNKCSELVNGNSNQSNG
jgi:hypothetical protein